VATTDERLDPVAERLQAAVTAIRLSARELQMAAVLMIQSPDDWEDPEVIAATATLAAEADWLAGKVQAVWSAPDRLTLRMTTMTREDD
jgi:hypothetical protein